MANRRFAMGHHDQSLELSSVLPQSDEQERILPGGSAGLARVARGGDDPLFDLDLQKLAA
jgi:hypothetical protein